MVNAHSVKNNTMEKHEINSVKRNLELEKMALERTEKSIENAKWYEVFYKRSMRHWVKVLNYRIKSNTTILEREAKKYYNL